MKKLIVISILALVVGYNYTDKQIETDNMNVTIEQTRQCAVDVQNGMQVAFCD